MFKSGLRVIGKRTWTVALLVLGSAILTPALFGNTCGVATLDQYLSGAEAGCTLDGYTVDFTQFTNFSANESADLLGAADITVTPTFTASELTLQFSGAFSNYTPGATEEYTFGYLLDPTLPHISGAGIFTGPNDPVGLTGQFCGDGTITSAPGCTAGGSFLSMGVSGNYSTTSALFDAPVTNVDTLLTLDLDTGSSVASFGATDTLVTPEPSALWLTPGLLGLVWLRKKMAGAVR
ncbi:MAG: hypothetical protein ABSH31_22205 [Bryobacteraceae bacterium]